MHKCDQCGKEFEKPQALRMHKIGAHRNKEQKQAKDLNENEQTNRNQNVALTPEERAIAERVSSQGTEDEWFGVREDELTDFSLANNPLNINEQNYPEAYKMLKDKKYAFRWCERTPLRIDELTRNVKPPQRWMLVTRTSMPALAKYVDQIRGCVCNLDQALLFKPYSHYMMVQEQKAKLAEAQLNSGSLKGKASEIQSKDDDVKVYEGSDYRITSADEVMADEAAFDQEGLGDLVE